MSPRAGTFLISLDFELYWGVRDAMPLERYRENLLGAREAIPRMLALFDEFGVRATWATVGFLFFDRREALLAAIPDVRPQYVNHRLSPYPALAAIGADEASDPFHYGRSLIDEIARHPGQEIATHTLSHFYCLEAGGETGAFRADMEAALRVGRDAGFQIRSVVFPRNQVSAPHLEVCAALGLIAYRGREGGWAYRPASSRLQSAAQGALRLVDAYADLMGPRANAPDESRAHGMVNVPASRFLRPYSRRLRHLEPLKERRITEAMTYAAWHGLAYHLWWHPHNFGRHTAENLAGLRRILSHYDGLRKRLAMESLTMADYAHAVLEHRAKAPIIVASLRPQAADKTAAG